MDRGPAFVPIPYRYTNGFWLQIDVVDDLDSKRLTLNNIQPGWVYDCAVKGAFRLGSHFPIRQSLLTFVADEMLRKNAMPPQQKNIENNLDIGTLLE